MRVMGLDVGARRIGVAFGDTETGVAAPAGVIVNESEADAAAEALRQAAERGAEAVVVGMPYTMAGRVGPQAEAVAAFVRLLEKSGAAVETVDERLSSAEAERALRASAPRGGRSKRKIEKGSVDAAAAAVILQAWLDGRRAGRE